MDLPKTAIICNPAAGEGLAKNRWEKFRNRLEEGGMAIPCMFTSAPGEGGAIAQELIQKGFRRIGSFGGDGTVNEVLQGIIAAQEAGVEGIELVFLSAGSSNDFEKKFSGNKSWVERLTSHGVQAIDYCRVDYQNFQGEETTHYFINNSSIGVICLAGEYFNEARGLTKKLKQVSVDAAAVTAGLKAIINYQPLKARLRIDGKAVGEQQFSNLTIYKTPHFGGGMYYNRGVEQNDGKLAVAQVRYASKLQLMGLIPALYAGTVFEKEVADYFECETLVIDSEGLMAVETDGEILGRLPARYSIVKQGILVVV